MQRSTLRNGILVCVRCRRLRISYLHNYDLNEENVNKSYGFSELLKNFSQILLRNKIMFLRLLQSFLHYFQF